MLTDPLTRLVLQSALLDPELAIKAWREALEISPIEDWSPTLARPLPRIYLNLRGHDHFTHANRMRGVYRATWAHNMVLLNRCAGVVDTLIVEQVPFRIIKGGAICAHLNTWGARRMGDIDLVAPHSRREHVAQILLNSGYRPLFPVRTGIAVGAWEDGHQGRIDLHLLSRDSEVARIVWQEPEVRVVTDGARLCIPSVGASMVLAAGHGVLGVDESDLIQAMLDVAALQSAASLHDVRRALTSRTSVDAIEMVIESLSDLGWHPRPDLSAVLKSARRSYAGMNALPARWKRYRRLGRKGLTAMLHRWRSPRALLSENSWLTRFPLYALWISTGHLRPVEARAVRLIGGFMPLPESTAPLDHQLTVRFTTSVDQTPQVNSWNVLGADSRFVIRVAGENQKRLTIECDEPHIQPRLLFINGRFKGWYPVDGHTTSEYEVAPAGGRIEASFRPSESSPVRWIDSVRIRVK